MMSEALKAAYYDYQEGFISRATWSKLLAKELCITPQTTNSVDVYESHKFITGVVFKNRWTAWLFHIILNRSIDHTGMRHY